MTHSLDILPLEAWMDLGQSPMVIGGPCSAETEEQLLSTAHLLANTGKVQVLRAGIWKPRTRPGEFEGIGSEGLAWMQKAKKETGLLLATEVANAQHVKEALDAGIDILWIGGRSSANLFIVQDICESLGGIDLTFVMLNQVNTRFV